jgi:hypothetical protein
MKQGIIAITRGEPLRENTAVIAWFRMDKR